MGGGPDRSQTAITRSQPRASACRVPGAVCDLVIDVIGGPMAADHIRHLLARMMETLPSEGRLPITIDHIDHKITNPTTTAVVKGIEGAAHAAASITTPITRSQRESPLQDGNNGLCDVVIDVIGGLQVRSQQAESQTCEGRLRAAAPQDIGMLTTLHARDDEQVVLARNPGGDQLAPLGFALEHKQPALACPPRCFQLPQARLHSSAHGHTSRAIMWLPRLPAVRCAPRARAYSSPS